MPALCFKLQLMQKIWKRRSKDIELIVNTLKQNHQLQLMLDNPVIKPAIKLSILNEIFQNKIGSQTIKIYKIYY